MGIIGKGIRHVARTVGTAAMKHGPKVLMGAGVAGVVTSATMVAKAAWDIRGSYEAVKDKLKYDEYTRNDFVKYAATKMAVPALIGIAGVACFFGAQKIAAKKQLLLASAYSIASETLATYQDKVIDKLGEETHRDILKDIAEEDLANEFPQDPTDECQEPTVIGKTTPADGDCLCYDRVTGRYFYSSKEKIREAEAAVVKKCANEMFVPVNDLYEELGLPDYSFIGNAIGWDATRCMPDIVFRSMLDENDTPCLVLIYSTIVIDSNELKGTA